MKQRKRKKSLKINSLAFETKQKKSLKSSSKVESRMTPESVKSIDRRILVRLDVMMSYRGLVLREYRMR
jgi:hypothetical protein